MMSSINQKKESRFDRQVDLIGVYRYLSLSRYSVSSFNYRSSSNTVKYCISIVLVSDQ